MVLRLKRRNLRESCRKKNARGRQQEMTLVAQEPQLLAWYPTVPVGGRLYAWALVSVEMMGMETRLLV
jgi:hypothetical protein